MNFPNMMYLDGAQVELNNRSFNPATEEQIVTVASASLKEVEIVSSKAIKIGYPLQLKFGRIDNKL